MYAVRFTSNIHNGWQFCIEDGTTKTFEDKIAAEEHAAECTECMDICFPDYEYVYEVVEV